MVQDTQAEPLLWKKPIVRFAITFSESARLLGIKEDANGAFKSEPLLWKKPIVRFAITFSESSRLLGIKEDANGAFKSGNDIQIAGRHSYILDLTTKWGKICATVERSKIKGKICSDTTDSDPREQPKSDKRTHLGIDNLLTNCVYAVASIDFKMIVSCSDGSESVVSMHIFLFIFLLSAVAHILPHFLARSGIYECLPAI
nr:hypothetical protein [Tanacetum cinerariifolium]